MKILAIRMGNLASLGGSTAIDFTTEPLLSAGIFAITGATGSGKSTILDALCLALYGKTPRYRLAETGIEVKDVGGTPISQGDVRGILRDGAAEGYAEVDFIGVDGQRYRAKWAVRRAGGRVGGSLQPVRVSLANIATQALLTDRRTELQSWIEQLVGLNFEQFTRSVLLAQGDFAAFLKANKEEKASLLEKLTGQEVYSAISQRIFERHRAENMRLRELELRRENIQTLTAEELTALEVEKTGFETQAQDVQRAIDALNADISWYVESDLLQSGRDAAYVTHGQAVEAQGAAQHRAQYLDRVERVQVVRSAMERRGLLSDELREKEKLLRDQVDSLEGLEGKRESVELSLADEEQALGMRTREQEEAQPGLDRAKALDVELSERQKQLGLADEEWQTVVVRQDEMSGTLQSLRQGANTVETEISRLSEWKKQHAHRQRMAENESLIVAKIDESVSLSDKHRNIVESLGVTERERDRLERAGAELRVREEKQAIAWRNASDTYDRDHLALEALAMTSLEQEKTAIDGELVELSEGVHRWELFWAASQELGRMVRKLCENEAGLIKGRADLEAAERELATAGLEKESLKKALEAVQLAASTSVTELRAGLTADEPCPVCGSRDHPYGMEHPLLDHAVANLAGRFDKQERLHQDWLRKVGRLQESVTQLTKEIGSMAQDRTERESILEGLQRDWTTCGIYAEAAEVPEAERSDWLRGRRQEGLEKQRGLQERLHAAHQLQRQVETGRDHRDRLEKALAEIREGLKDNARIITSTTEKRALFDKEKEEAERGLAAIEKQLVEYLTAEELIAGWRVSPKETVGAVGEIVLEWKANGTALEKQLANKAALAIKIGSIEEQLVGMDADLKDKENKTNALKKAQAELREERNQLFAGSPVAVVEQELKTAVIFARQTVDTRRAEKEELGKQLTKMITEKEQNEALIGRQRESLIQAERQLGDWLSIYNRENEQALTMEHLEELLRVTPEWRRAEHAALQQLDNTVTRTQAVLKERESALAKHGEQGQPQRVSAELAELLASEKSTLAETTKHLNEIDYRLKEDAEHKERIGELLREIGTQGEVVENWAKLNEVIGSADGKKFRQIAQEYTLDVLLQYTNVHLGRLSTRYVLQRIPATLGLQVVDLDMGDEVRTVYSLSGGESFLVSLSLALGLASLTSSRMRVESLFIDEGFGSLDPNTLSIAMDALERLHQQGRKVGVISHVQEMTERIPVQIRVTKGRGGVSRVDVVG